MKIYLLSLNFILRLLVDGECQKVSNEKKDGEKEGIS